MSGKLIEKLQEVKTHIGVIEKELMDLDEKKRKSSAPRARAGIQKAKSLLQELRHDIMIDVKKIPTKTRVKLDVGTKNDKLEVDKLEVDKLDDVATIVVDKPKRKRAPKKVIGSD